MARLSPDELYRLYKKGFQGCLWEEHVFEHLLENSKYAYFKDGSRSIKNSGKGKLSLPYKSVLKFDKNPYNERQTVGDCLDPNSIVISEHCKFIKDVEVGDIIYGSDGSFTTIISKQVKISNNPLVTIKTKGSIPLKVTSDHRVFIGRNENQDCGNTQTKTLVKKWVAAQEIKKGDYLITPTILTHQEKPLTNKFLKDKDFEWFLGYFLGDGWCDGKNLEITFAKHQEKLFIKCFNFLNRFNFNPRKCYYKGKNTSAFRLRCWCPELSSFLRNICYDNQKNKVFPNWAIGSENIVKGLIESDGFIADGKVTFDSVSSSLAYGVYYSYLKMGYKPTINYFHRSKNGSFKDSQAYRVSCIYNKQKNYSFIKDNELYILVSKTEIKEGPHEVYDIGVANKEHAFIANGCIVHNCVSHSTRNACDVTRAVEIDINKDREAWIAKGATEAIYGARGHGGEGMSCARAAEFVSKYGGILVRKNYPGIIDLSKYDGRLGAKWGGRGLPDNVLDLANDYQIKTVSLIKTVEEARDALANGYGLSVCSNYGFSNKRDAKGFAKPQGSWAHAMAWIACDDTGSEPAFLVQNSWGKWNSGGHPEWGPIPDGSFLITADTAQGMLNGRAAYAFSDFDGFPLQKLPDYGFDYL
jgi:intein/homing endonuclease